MNCHEARAHLSSYYDRQLMGELQQTVADHVRNCQSCSHELDAFASLSKLTQSSFTKVAGLDTQKLQTPGDLWSRIEYSLHEVAETKFAEKVPLTVIRPEVADSGSTPTDRRFRWHSSWIRLKEGTSWQAAALAALLLVAVGAGLFWFQGREGHHHASQGRLAHYINTFVHDADAAQRTLIADYGAQRVDLQEASLRLGYQPVIPNRLPEGYSLEAIYVFEMDCCNCAQYVCHRGEAEPITIFEHGKAHPEHLANCPTQETYCSGQRCQLGQVGKEWIASWQVGPRQITVVGAHDVEEVEQLVAHFSQLKYSNTEQGA